MFTPLQQIRSSCPSLLQDFTYAIGQLPSPHPSCPSLLQDLIYAIGQLPSLQVVLDISHSTNVSCCLQADMPLPSPVTPLALPRQTSPLYDPKPAFSTSITATALQSTSSNPAKVHNSSSNSTLTSQHSSSSTATAAVLASLQQQHGLGMHLEPPRVAEERQQPGQDTQATATSRRYVLSGPYTLVCRQHVYLDVFARELHCQEQAVPTIVCFVPLSQATVPPHCIRGVCWSETCL